MIDTISPEERQRNTLDALLDREREAYQYQVNIDNYTAMLAALPSEWTEELLPYQGVVPDDIVNVVPSEHQQAVSDLLFAGKIAKLLVTEQFEKAKVVCVYDALATNIDPEELEGLLVARAAERAAE